MPLAPEIGPPEKEGAKKMTESGKTRKLAGCRDRLTKGQDQIRRNKPVVKGKEMLKFMVKLPFSQNIGFT